MCGIAGVIGEYDPNILNKMVNSTRHRGPDQCGKWENDRVGLAVNRLAIIDPSVEGRQPISTHEPSSVIAYNGETYNYKSLKNNLLNSEFEFETNTDTEVVLNHILKNGPNGVVDLNGIFAFAIYNEEDQNVHLFRDRLGIKPLYYYNSGDVIAFCSELKGILSGFSHVNFTQSAKSIHEFMGGPQVSNESLFEEIQSIPPGSHAKIDVESKSIEIKEYYNIPHEFDRNEYLKKKSHNELELVNELDKRLNNAVKRQLMSDVPIATLCSGGVDSSLIAAIANQYHSDIQMYHVNVKNRNMTEYRYAKKVSDYLDMEMNVFELSEESFGELINDAIIAGDLPLARPNSVGIYAISKLASDDEIKVLLTGEGADELFGGYGRYEQLYYKHMLNDFNPLRKVINKLLPEYISSDIVAASFIEDFDTYINAALKEENLLKNKQDSLTSDRRKLINSILHEMPTKMNDSRAISNAYMISEYRNCLLSLLHRVDRMSMAHSLEARVPMLDNHVLEFALTLPHEYKIRRREKKYLLKKVASRYLPDDVVYRDKKAFPVPWDEWLKNNGYDLSAGFRNISYGVWKNEYIKKSSIET